MPPPQKKKMEARNSGKMGEEFGQNAERIQATIIGRQFGQKEEKLNKETTKKKSGNSLKKKEKSVVLLSQ